jgi:hypothetical protein
MPFEDQDCARICSHDPATSCLVEQVFWALFAQTVISETVS